MFGVQSSAGAKADTGELPTKQRQPTGAAASSDGQEGSWVDLGVGMGMVKCPESSFKLKTNADPQRSQTQRGGPALGSSHPEHSHGNTCSL